MESLYHLITINIMLFHFQYHLMIKYFINSFIILIHFIPQDNHIKFNYPINLFIIININLNTLYLIV